MIDLKRAHPIQQRVRAVSKYVLILALTFAFVTGTLCVSLDAPLIESVCAKKDKAKGKPAHAGKNDNGSQEKNSGRNKGSNQDWRRDWHLDRFLKVGFTTATLHALLGDDTAALRVNGKPLPPGIGKQIERGKPQPPGIAKRQPASALRQISARIDGAECREVGLDLVLVEAGTQVVREVLRDVLR